MSCKISRRSFLKVSGCLMLGSAVSGLVCGAGDPAEGGAAVPTVGGLRVNYVRAFAKDYGNNFRQMEIQLNIENTNSSAAYFNQENFVPMLGNSRYGGAFTFTGLNKWNGSRYVQDVQLKAGETQTISYSCKLQPEDLSSRDDETLTEVVGKTSAEACAAGLNYLAQVYHDGTRVTYPLYSEKEIAAVPARAHAELYYCPAQQPGAKFAIVLSGNALYYSGELRGGVSTAWELHEQGYAVFSLRYRIGWEAGDDAPLEDLARAIRFVMDNADTFGVSTEDYALLGYSSGGQLAGVFGNEEKGWGRYGVPKPGVLLLVYPINNFLGAKPAYHLLMDTDRLERRYYSYTVSKLVTPDYPPTFLWYGRNDLMLKAFVYPLQGPTLAKALEASGVPNRVEVYDNAKHGIGIGVGTDAEGWVERAAEFWQSVSE